MPPSQARACSPLGTMATASAGRRGVTPPLQSLVRSLFDSFWRWGQGTGISQGLPCMLDRIKDRAHGQCFEL
jgi:hypothetical protein